MSNIAKRRLALELSNLRTNPLKDFEITPDKNENGKPDLYKWICYIPGKILGPWAGARYRLSMSFDDDYPIKPPKCKFDTVLFHPNVFPSGTVCLSILNEDEDWVPSITVRQILLGIQDLLDHPNILSPAQTEPFQIYKKDYNEYLDRIKKQIESIKESEKNA